MNKIIQNIKVIRESLNLSQNEMAERMNLTQSSYARFERGASKTDLELVELFARETGYSLIDLITYPDQYVRKSEVKSDPVEAVLQIKLQADKKEQVLKLVFGENNLEILNK